MYINHYMDLPMQYRSGFSPVEDIVLEGEITPSSSGSEGDDSSSSGPPAPEVLLNADTVKSESAAVGAIPAGAIVAS